MLPGTRLHLLNSQGVVCEARIEELLLLGQAFTSDYGSELYKRAHLDVKLPSSREEIAPAATLAVKSGACVACGCGEPGQFGHAGIDPQSIPRATKQL